jgi:alpha-galactosidase
MPVDDHWDIPLGDMVARYRRGAAGATVGLELIPTALLDQAVPRREYLTEPAVTRLPSQWGPFRAWNVDPLAHLKVLGDDCPGGFAQGRTMRGASPLTFVRQDVVEEKGPRVLTTLRHPAGLEVVHELAWRAGLPYVAVRTTATNCGTAPVSLELLTSVSLGGITPFDNADAPQRLWLHRFRSGWSSEGRLESAPAEALHLDRSWTGHSVFCERFGQVGSIPSRGFFPRVLAEDRGAGVFWGAQLAWAGSWQLEMYRKDDCLCLSGGLADREFGHWLKTLKPGESIVSPPAYLSVVRGDLETICERLNGCYDEDAPPASECELPIIFNDWCLAWGRPTQELVEATLKKLAGTPVKYFVVDAGWYAGKDGNWEASQGDWIASASQFPNGLRAVADAIRAAGMVPGLWFECEVVGKDAAAFSLVDHLLKRDGKNITVAGRRFWDLRDPWVIDYLRERVIGLLKSCGFGYLKIDYNETIGIGCDGADSLGEGLRQQIEAIHRWLDLLRAEMPELVIENCSSGGHRHEPSIVGRCAMTSFSDAHETVDIPIIAGNLQNLLPARKTQVWAVLRVDDTRRRLVYSLAATFLGRMCLSGDIHQLSPAQWQVVGEGMALYREVFEIIRDGRSCRFGTPVLNYHHPKGWQAVVRHHGDHLLAVVHHFESADAEFVIPDGAWRVAKVFQSGGFPPEVDENNLRCFADGAFSGQVVLLIK